MFSSSSSPSSTKRKRVGMQARVEKLNRERSVAHIYRLPDQLIEPLLSHHAIAVGIDVHAVILPRRGAVDRHPKAHGSGVGAWAQHQMQIARVKPINDFPGTLFQCRIFTADTPLAGQ